MYFLFIFVFVGFVIKVLVSFHLPDVPLIYPQRSDVTVDAHSNLTLGCRGAEPMRWTFHDDVNSLSFNQFNHNINVTINKNEPELKYESILTVYNVSHVNIGFYYCHAEVADFDTARRSSRIYVFVYDEDNLSVITSEQYNLSETKWTVLIPCRPTSQDINITLMCNYFNLPLESMLVTPSNYTRVKWAREYEMRFHPYSGFQVRFDYHIGLPNLCECVFRRNEQIFSVVMSKGFTSSYDINYYTTGLIEAPDTAELGEDITLQCTVMEGKYFPYDVYWHWLQWDSRHTRNKLIINLKKINLGKFIVLISTMTIKNISIENEGLYKCGLKKYEQSEKYIYVKDKKTNHSIPRIYSPSSGDTEINSGENITLRCAGVRPVTWTAEPQVHRSYYTEHLFNFKAGQYESLLHIYDAHYTDTGFYHCYENDTDERVRLYKSAKLYIYVKDERNFYIQQNDITYTAPYENVTVPCLPTSRDVNVSLLMMYKVYDDSFSRLVSEQIIHPVIYSYDPRRGFSVRMPDPGIGNVTATCTFVTRTTTATLDIQFYVIGSLKNLEPCITGPTEDLVFVEQILELSCAAFVLYNISDDALRWTLPKNSTASEIITQIKRINFGYGKVLISKLMVNNVKISNAGRYSCHLDNFTANKVISVYDKFDLEVTIVNLQNDYAYVGQPFALLCNVSVDHNEDFPGLSWTTPDDPLAQAKIMITEFFTNIRSIHGQRVVQIDNVTHGDSGNYTCSLSDFINRKRQVTRNVAVKKGVKPRIVSSNFKELEEVDVFLEGIAELTCTVEGDPKPVITWMKGSSELRRLGQHIEFFSNNSELTIYFVQKTDAGLYTCIAENLFGRDSCAVNLRVISTPVSGWYIGFVSFVIILIAVVAVLLRRNIYRRKKHRKALFKSAIINLKSGEIQNWYPFLNKTELATLLPYDHKWEIPRNRIKLGRNLGSGSFGLVVEATVSNYFDGEPEKTVAVKMLHPYSNFMDFHLLMCELNMMTQLGEHSHLINLLGACTGNIGEKRLLVVIEYCKYGNLRDFLIENRCAFVNLIDPDTELICFSDADSLQDAVSTLQLLHWALQAARGMEFLAAKQILHGDLAARNILLADNYVVKISDFGLSKALSSGYYKKKTQCPLPIKWMAIESIRDKTFSTQSDVWAFGVVLWELFSLARTPYAELEPDLGFYRKLESGYRLERPEYSTREIYQVMRECWCAQPRSRPIFSVLARTLSDLLAPAWVVLDIHTTTTDN